MSSHTTPASMLDAPPPYHDGRATERLPAYRESHLRRHHPYAREESSLLQRLQLSSWPSQSKQPEGTANIGLQARLAHGPESPSTVDPGEGASASTTPAPNSQISSGLHVDLDPPSCRCTATSTRVVKRKRDEFENDVV